MQGRFDPTWVISVLQTLVLRNGTVSSGITSNIRSLADAPAESLFFEVKIVILFIIVFLGPLSLSHNSHIHVHTQTHTSQNLLWSKKVYFLGVRNCHLFYNCLSRPSLSITQLTYTVHTHTSQNLLGSTAPSKLGTEAKILQVILAICGGYCSAQFGPCKY